MSQLSERSMKELQGVHPRLMTVVMHASEISIMPFLVTDGLRTEAEQKELVRIGASKTMKSMHLAQADGYGHAVDLVPVVHGKPRWELPACCEVAKAMLVAAREHGVRLVWGAVWDSTLNTLVGRDLMAEIDQYGARRCALGKRPFIDAPHFELVARAD